MSKQQQQTKTTPDTPTVPRRFPTAPPSEGEVDTTNVNGYARAIMEILRASNGPW